MNVLVYTENWDGKFKKITSELLSYASYLTANSGGSVSAVSIGEVADADLQELAKYGASSIYTTPNPNGDMLDNDYFSTQIAKACLESGSDCVLLADNFTGKALAPKISVKLKAGLVPGVVNIPLSFDPFIFPKRSYSAKVFSDVKILSEKMVLTLVGNSIEVKEKAEAFNKIELAPDAVDIQMKRTNIQKQTGTVLLSDADVVVSGGRGMRAADNWGGIEKLAEVLGAATACSRPVSDEGWRPHHEHVGQTGKVIAPTVYFALGISGAIQHLAGVNSSKVIVAVNKDPEAPIFQAADYGVVGDVNKVLPQLIEAAEALKAE